MEAELRATWGCCRSLLRRSAASNCEPKVTEGTIVSTAAGTERQAVARQVEMAKAGRNLSELTSRANLMATARELLELPLRACLRLQPAWSVRLQRGLTKGLPGQGPEPEPGTWRRADSTLASMASMPRALPPAPAVWRMTAPGTICTTAPRAPCLCGIAGTAAARLRWTTRKRGGR